MFEAIQTDIQTSPVHGGFVLLESYQFENGDLTVRIFAPGTNDSRELRFCDVIGFTMTEDVFGSNGGQITREDINTPGYPSTAPKPARGFFMKSAISPTMMAIQGAVPAPFSDAVQQHMHFRLSLREYELSFVANRDYEINVVSSDMLN